MSHQSCTCRFVSIPTQQKEKVLHARHFVVLVSEFELSGNLFKILFIFLRKAIRS